MDILHGIDYDPVPPLTPAELAQVRTHHQPEPYPFYERDPARECGECLTAWPCHAARLLATLDAATNGKS